MPNVLRILQSRVAPVSALKIAALSMLFVAALVSAAQGLRNAQRFSEDLQWSPAVLFVKGENPYTHFLEGNSDGAIIFTQDPNYAHGLYVLLAPLALLQWGPAKLVWSIANVLGAFLLASWIARRAGLSAGMRWVLVLAFFCSTPFRNNLANGQLALFCLIAACGALAANRVRGALLTGLSYLKYSFAPPLAAYELFRHGLKYFLLSLLPGLVGYALFMGYIGGNAVEVLMQPLKVSAQTFQTGDGDLMSLVSELYPQRQGVLYVLLFYVVPLALSTAVAFFAAKRVSDPFLAFSIVCAVALVCFKHLRYDFVFLLPAFAYALAHPARTAAKLALALIAFDWYAIRLFDPAGVLHVTQSRHVLLFINLAICVGLIASLFWMGRKSAPIAPASQPAVAQ